MAVYKVIQDIEAEDKLLGPLTLKSFVYAGIAGVLIFIEFRLLIAGVSPVVRVPIMLALLFPTALFGVLASPLGHDQPTEIWLLSHVRFLLKPHQRVWDQRDSNNTVTITAPKIVEKQLTKGFSQTEVQSRLSALATTLDSHGWAVKNSAVSLDDQPGYLDGSSGDSDRLIGASTMAQPAPVLDVHDTDDIMDEKNNATAQHFNQLMQAADVQRKEAIIKKIDEARQGGTEPTGGTVDSRFLDKAVPASGGDTTFVGKAVVAPKTDDNDISSTDDSDDQKVTAEDRALLEKWHKRDADIHRRSSSFHAKAEPEPPAPPTPPPAAPAAPEQTEEDKQRQDAMTAAAKADKLELSQSGNDLSVASVASLANRKEGVEQISPNEIVISLH